MSESALPQKRQQRLEVSNHLFRKGHYKDALEGYRDLLTGLGGSPMHSNVGYCYQALDQHQEAVEHFEKYVEEFPYRHHGWKSLSFSYYHLNDFENMSRCARESIKWDIQRNLPDDYSWQQMATAHFLLGDLSTALKASRKALEINPNNGFSLYYKACILYAVRQGADFDQPELITEPVTLETCADTLAEAIACTPSLLKDAEEEGHVTLLLTHSSLKNATAWCEVAQLIIEGQWGLLREKLGISATDQRGDSEAHELEEVISPHKDQDDGQPATEQSDSTVGSSDESAEGITTLFTSTGVDLNLQLSGWSFVQISAREEKSEALKILSLARAQAIKETSNTLDPSSPSALLEPKASSEVEVDP
jgi:tetratricopeptide (TPR) repeat protein